MVTQDSAVAVVAALVKERGRSVFTENDHRRRQGARPFLVHRQIELPLVFAQSELKTRNSSLRLSSKLEFKLLSFFEPFNYATFITNFGYFMQ